MQQSKIKEAVNVFKHKNATRAIFSDIDGTVYQWQLLIDLVLAIAKNYPEKRSIVKPLRAVIVGYKRRETPFRVVIDVLISIIPHVFKGVNKKRVQKFAAARARSVQSKVYVFPKEMLKIAKSLDGTDDPYVLIAITGAPQEVAEPFCAQLGFDVVIGSYYQANRRGTYTGERDIDSGINKGAYIDAIDSLYAIDFERSIAKGDSEHDHDMFDRCGYAYAINPNTTLVHKLRESAKDESWYIVRDGQKSGVQISAVNQDGALYEVCASCAMPPDIASVFPLLPGMLDPENCACSSNV
ncbi:HAD hydrolase family protein [Candidatus Uhrbacteria bacterium]|nr:HAD hydrolase family protein [Candidatus Uhrbacteria bacterium]